MFKYILLGIVQGATEFLPVSSSGHLVILQYLFGITEEGLAVSITLHLGTLLALIIFLFKDILKVLKDLRMLFLIAVVTAITGIIGVSQKEFFEKIFFQPKLVGIALGLSGLILISTRFFKPAEKKEISFKDALLLGLAQALAIIPGISRSGTTLAMLLFRGIDRQRAFNFSLMVFIPAVLGAVFLEAKKINFIFGSLPGNLILSFFFSLITGMSALYFLKLTLSRGKLHYFGYYCLLAALAVFILIR